MTAEWWRWGESNDAAGDSSVDNEVQFPRNFGAIEGMRIQADALKIARIHGRCGRFVGDSTEMTLDIESDSPSGLVG